MHLSFALVKNLRSSGSELVFSNFTLREIQHEDIDVLKRAQELFPGGDASYGDWIYERHYAGFADDQLGKIPVDTEDILLLLRLYKVGDLVFLQPCTQIPDGRLLRQLPYRVMSYISTVHRFEMYPEECSDFNKFVADITSRENWSSIWFHTTRSFFLLGGSTEFNPKLTYFDRVVDYMIALESALIPERDFVGRRLRERAALLLTALDMEGNETKRILKKFYEIRSTVAHGADTTPLINSALENAEAFEKIVRMTIVEALKKTPLVNTCRETFLKQLFDVCDQARVEQMKRCISRLSKRVAESSSNSGT